MGRTSQRSSRLRYSRMISTVVTSTNSAVTTSVIRVIRKAASRLTSLITTQPSPATGAADPTTA